MATRNLVPRSDGEGSIGTTLKKWLKGWFASIFVSGNLTDGTYNATVAQIRDAIDNPSIPDADEIATDESGETVQDKIDDADTHIADTNNPHSVDKTDVSLSNVDDVQQMPLSYLDTDDALGADSDEKVSSQSAVKSYIDALLSANDAMTYKGVIDCSGNPNYPEADAGDTYRISVAGKIGGASGISVEVGDIAICIADSTASGDQATVGEFWNIIQVNIDGAVVAVSPFTSTDDNIPKYSGTSGRILEDSGVAIATVSNHIANTENPHSVEADQVATDDSGETVQDKIDDADAHIADTANPHSVDKTDVSLSNVDDVQQMPLSYLDTDDALGADSDEKVSSQSAVKSYIDALLSANDAMTYKGVIDCSGNPNYPEADAGDTYRISVAGKIGGASGISVEVGDIAICIADSTASGDQATVGEFWNIIQVNIDGAVVAVSPFTSTDDNIPKYSGTSGRILEDSGVAIATVSNHIANTENPHSVEADQVATDDSGETVQDKIDDADAHIADTANPHSVDKADVGLTDVPNLDTTDAVNHVSATENPHSVEADQVATDDSGVNVQDALDSVESDVVDLKKSSVTFIIDGGGAEITTGIKGDILVPFTGTITKATLLADQSGSIVVDIWNDIYDNFAPDNDDSITASAPPTITTAIKNQDSTLTGWTKAISAGDILRFNVDSITDIERVTLTLDITRT